MVDAADDKPAGPTPAQGIPMKLVVIVAVVALVMGLGGAFAVVKLAGGSHAPGDEKTDATPEKKGGHEEATPKAASGTQGTAPGAMFDLEPFIVNLADAPEIRYLKLTMKLEVDAADPGAELGSRVPQIRDTILVLLSSKESSAIRTPQGKFQLRDEITKRVNDLLPKASVRTAYFTEFVVQ